MLKWTDPSIHAKHFVLHQKTFGSGERRTSTFFIVHCLLTNVSLSNMVLLIQHLHQSAEMATIKSHLTITEQEYIGKLRVWSESTSTSPSGMYLGHYKALIARHAYTDLDSTVPKENAKRDECNHMLGCLLRLHVQLLNYALERAYAYKRWHTINNTIFFKNLENVRIHRTRAIYIYEVITI
jgi:hypothetical protein